MSNVTLTGSICLTVFLFIVFVYFRLRNFSFFHLCCPITYVGEIKLYIVSCFLLTHSLVATVLGADFRKLLRSNLSKIFLRFPKKF